jgi:hypothetical protein
MDENRWENCVAHYDASVLSFFEEHFSDETRKCLLIGGAGFDPRSAELVKQLSNILGARLFARLIKEERPDPDPELVQEADVNLQKIREYCNSLEVEVINIFAEDNAVVGGRNAVESLSGIQFDEYTDIVIDMSALSMGVSFPVVSYVYDSAKGLAGTVNVHLVVLSNPELDALISSSPNDRVTDVRGFDRRELFGESEKARLWLPQLSEGKKEVLKKIHSEVRPHDTCPILPFPAVNPKKGDRIACSIFSSIQTELGGPLENEWGLDPRNFVYADERKPLDLYRTILKIDDERRPVFKTFGGSIIILSPLGSKIPTVGALMAALERDFPVVYVETLAYDIDWEKVRALRSQDSQMAHVWLYGDAYLRDIETSL